MAGLRKSNKFNKTKRKSKGPNYNLLTGGKNNTLEEEKLKLNSFWDYDGYVPPNDIDNFLVAMLKMADTKIVIPIIYPMEGSDDIDEAIENADFSIDISDTISSSSIFDVKDNED